MASLKDMRSQSSKKDDATIELVSRFGRLELLDDLVRLRALDEEQVPILAYPKLEGNTIVYDRFTGKDLDRLISNGVAQLGAHGFRKTNETTVIALLTISDMDMVIMFLALSRLGYTVMMLSPRLPATACATVRHILELKSVTIQPLLRRIPDGKPGDFPGYPDTTDARDPDRIALILHSSGSTGTPKPLFLTHRALMTHPLRGPGLTSFNSLPWYHLHGLSTALQAMWQRKTAFMWNASLPLTTNSLVQALHASQPESISAVPYALQLLIESPSGIDALRRCSLVTYGGAPCPDELGNRLVDEGVRFGGAFGLTEAGLVAESISRPLGDKAWNYLRFFPDIQKFIYMKPLGDNLFECVYLRGHPALTTSNSNDPPGSYHSKDIFRPHPVLPDRWKYVTRLDDRIVLLNGEKVLPLPIEGCIKQHPAVREAVVVGVGKAVPALLVFRSDSARETPESDLIEEIWPVVQTANARSEQFSQILRDMIAIVPPTMQCPLTDKGSLIRAKVYADFADVINHIYENIERSSIGSLQLSLEGTKTHLLQLCRSELGVAIEDIGVSFFDQGFDSLKALHLRRLVLRDFKLRPSEIGHNIVFETGNVHRLAEHVRGLQTGQTCCTEDELDVMKKLLKKFSKFEEHSFISNSHSEENGVILTGATGSLGSHILSQLLQDDSVSVIYCFTRSKSPMDSVLASLQQRRLGALAQAHRCKIVALRTSLHEQSFGLEQEVLEKMRDTVSLIIHTAWPVNFNLSLRDFEPHIQGLHNLIQFSLSVHLPRPALALFCSSISTALGSLSMTVEEALLDFGSALNMGYGRSKLIGEHIVSNASKVGARAYSLRIGQISGDSEHGIWNDSEALPLMIRSALTLGALPMLEMNCSWLPVNTLASVIIDLARVHSPWVSVNSRRDSGYSTDGDKNTLADETIYNICNPLTFSWHSLLNEVQLSGVPFETVPFEKWLAMLQESEARGESSTNPAVKLVDHYRTLHRQSIDGASQNIQPSHLQDKTFVISRTARDSTTFRDNRQSIIEDGIMKRYLDTWLKHWQSLAAMRFLGYSAIFAALAAVSTAAPAEKKQFSAEITFIGAAGASFTQSFVADGSNVAITNSLSISHISSDGGATCSFKGVDGSNTVVVGAETVDVGPPQTQVSGSCLAL
ncbi:NRPS-like enzyme [Paecilomyces variotii No. 5]|uniref:NRPS-like enzyme n=1 Tax=Byssochlamys spectabilis (strain No. 5 / NBRC 109023) TaxID=1356009 RepID=V5FVX0_BYSSN|nr:NRPS-like enzyme [Paecilomyces variotii No. 5]